IKRGGLVVFARLVAADRHKAFKKELLSSGNGQLDALTAGGLHTGTSNLLMGPAGSGKSTIAVMFADAAARRGQRVSYYAFDESNHILRARAAEMGLDFDKHIQAGKIRLAQMDPAQIAPGELAHNVVRSVEEDGINVVVLD